MYPYNRKTQPAFITAKEKSQNNRKPQNPPALSTDRRLFELLLLARQEAAALEAKYGALAEAEELAEAAAILHTMQTDTKKQQRILQEILYTIFSDTDVAAPTATEPAETAQSDAAALLEELLLTELDDITFYRQLLFAMTEEDLWTLLFEILTDKQNHTAALNHLYAKYFVKTTGNGV